MESIWKRECVNLGRQGENAARPIQVYLTAWLTEYPAATVELLILRPGEDTPYNPASTSLSDGVFTWTPTSADTAIGGYGKAELRATENSVIVKSEVVKTFVEPCLEGTASEDPPASLKTWIDTINGKLDAPEEAGSAGNVLKLNSSLEPVWGAGGGGGGAEIDDTAGTGDTDKAWSANKLVTEFSGKQDAPAAAPSGSSTQPVLALVGGVPTWVDKISFTRNVSSGVQIAAIRVDGAAQATQIYAPVCTVVTDAATTLTLLPYPTTYNFGEVNELTLTVTATSQYHFMFTCPSGAATVLTLNGITGKTGDTTLAAGKTYEVDVWAGIALFKEIEVTAV